MSELSALTACERLLALAAFLQALEHLQQRALWSDRGAWQWKILRKDHSRALAACLGLALGESGFQALLIAELLAAATLAVWPNTWAVGVIFLATWLTSIRWRGTFNGGSDSMTALVALALWVAGLGSRPGLTKACLAYIAIQLVASYALAGIAKLRNPEWRNGRALPALFRVPGYDRPPAALRALVDRPAFARAGAWMLIAFECAFPLAFASRAVCIAFIAAALGFHLTCFRALGLNRFVFAWSAAYPALLYWSSR